MEASPFAGLPSFDEPAGTLLEARRQGSVGPEELRRVRTGRSSLDDGLLQAVAAARVGGVCGGSGGSDGSLLRSATVANPFDMAELLSQINLLVPKRRVPALGSAGSGGPCTITDGTNRTVKWIQPSGPRHLGQGVEDVEQGVMLAEPTPTGGALLRVTLLAAGFIIGPSGSCVRDVCKATETDIKSWTANPDDRCPRSCRVFRVEGPRHGVAKAVGILCDAVGRYKELCEGRYAGQSVVRIQHVSGVDFSYQPPPRNIVPYAASLKGQAGSRRQNSGQAGKQTVATSSKPPAAPGHSHPGSNAAAGLSRASSLGASGGSIPVPSNVPAPAGSLGLARSTSLPRPQASGGGSGRASQRQEGSPPSRQLSLADPQPAGLDSARSSSRGEAGPWGPGAKSGGGSGAAAAASAAATAALGDGGGGSNPGPRRAAAKMKRSASEGLASTAHAQQQRPQPAAPSPALKLDKENVMRYLFGSEQAAAGSPDGPAPTAADLSLLLQQLALQDAHHQQASSAAAMAAQQGVRGGYELSEPGVLLPASLSPMAPDRHNLLAFGGDYSTATDAYLAARGLAGDANMLAAVASVWQTAQPQQGASSGQRLQMAAAGMLAPQAAGGGGGLPPVSQPFTRRSSQPLAPHPSLDAASQAALVAAAAAAADYVPDRGSLDSICSSGGTGGGGGFGSGYPEQEQHVPLSTFMPPHFMPFSSVGSPPGSFAPAPAGSPASPPNMPSGAWASPQAGLDGASAWSPQSGCSSGSATTVGGGGGGGGGHSWQGLYESEPSTPGQPRPAAPAAMPTPPSGSMAPGGGGGAAAAPPPAAAAAASCAPSSAFAARGGMLDFGTMFAPVPAAAGGVLDITNTFASAFALLPGGDLAQPGGDHLAFEPAGPGEEHLSTFSSSNFMPLSGAALARAASVPGPQVACRMHGQCAGSCTPMDRLQDMLSMARVNSYAAPNDPCQGYGPEFAGGGLSTPDMHTAFAPLGPPGTFASPEAALQGGSIFASAFSPQGAPGLRQAPSLPSRPLPAGAAADRQGSSLGARSSSAGAGAGGDLFGEVDRMVDAMF